MELISKTLEVKKYIPKTDPYGVEKRRRTRNEPEKIWIYKVKNICNKNLPDVLVCVCVKTKNTERYLTISLAYANIFGFNNVP